MQDVDMEPQILWNIDTCWDTMYLKFMSHEHISRQMKSLEQQIVFLDRELLPLYGFSSIADYETIITVQTILQNPQFLDVINKLVDHITDVYPVKKIQSS